MLNLKATGATALAPLAGALVGLLGCAVYWLSAELWPANVAVILAMAATELLATDRQASAPGIDWLLRLFFLFIKYNTLMALSAAELPFAVPANLTLGFVMVCGYAASYSLLVLGLAARPDEGAPKLSVAQLCLALLLGFAPATLLGVPGLAGLAAAIVVSLGLVAFRRARRAQLLDVGQPLAEVSFYLGALASWRFV